jgi:pyruvate kinase
MRNTKIVATVGPASRSPEMLRALLKAGVDVFRINASHGVYGEHAGAIQLIREIAAESGATPGILLGLQPARASRSQWRRPPATRKLRPPVIRLWRGT